MASYQDVAEPRPEGRQRSNASHLVVRGNNGYFACMRCAARGREDTQIYRKPCRPTDLKVRFLRRELLAGAYDEGLGTNQGAANAAAALGWRRVIE